MFTARALRQTVRQVATRASHQRVAYLPLCSLKAALPRPSFARGISSTVRCASQVKAELAAKLDEEINYEKQEEDPALPEECAKFLKTSGWQLKSQDNAVEVQLEKQVGDDIIKVSFSVLPADEEVDPEEEEDEEESSRRYSDPMELTVDVVKANDPSAGALTFFVTLDIEAAFFITDVQYCSDASLITNPTAQADEARAEVYQGPRYFDLDERLQDKFAEYLGERGVGLKLCDFMQEYARWKEQRLYVDWLKNVKTFVEK